MQKINKYFFNIVFFLIISLLIFIFFKCNSNYWLKYCTGITVLPFKHKLMLYLGRIFCISTVMFLLYFKKAIYNNRKKLGLSLITIVIWFVFLETISRIYVCRFMDSSIQSKVLLYGQCNRKPIYSPHHYLNYHGTPGYRSSDGKNMHNSMGFRGPEIKIPKPEDVYRIVILGGSTVYTNHVRSWKKDFSRQLEMELWKKYKSDKIEVINAGVGGYNSWETLINFEFKVLDVQPDMIIVYQGTNDVHARMIDPSYYRGDNSGRRRQWDPEPIPLLFHSTLVRLITRINPTGLGLFVNTPTSKPSVMNTGFVKELNGTPMETLQKNKPVYFERNLRNIIAIAKEHNISVLLATWAHSNRFNDYSATPHYEKGFAENNEVVKKVGSDHNVPVYDFASEMPMDEKFWSDNDGRHVNELGAELKGKLFANFIYLNKLIDNKVLSAEN